MTGKMFQTIHKVHHTARPWLIETLANYQDSKHIIMLRSPKEMRLFVNQQSN